MIELARAELGDHQRERWDRALATKPLLARRGGWDPRPLTLAAWLSLGPVLATLEGPTPFAVVARALAGAAWLAAGRAALAWLHARRARWPSGRLLFRWGFVESERDVVRIVPMDVIAHEVRGRFLGVGPITLRLRSGWWSDVIVLHADEIERVATALGEGLGAARIPLATAGYRDSPPRMEGPRARFRLGSRTRDVAWSIAMAGVVVLAHPNATVERRRPQPPTSAWAEPPPSSLEPDEAADALPRLRAPYLEALRTRLDPSTSRSIALEIEPCSYRAEVVASVVDQLRTALARPERARAPVLLSPSLVKRPRAWARIWAECTWQLDTAHVLRGARARWGLSLGGEAILEREAFVGVGDAIGLVGECQHTTHSASFPPAGWVIATLELVEGAIQHEVYEDPATEAEAVARAPHVAMGTHTCVASRARGVAITHVRDLEDHRSVPAR